MACLDQLLPAVYILTLSDSNGCETEYDIQVSFPGFTESEIGENAIQVFPNPTDGTFHIKIPSSLSRRHVKVQIVGNGGQVIHQQRLSQLNQTISVQSQDLAPGIYFLQFYAQGEWIATRKMVVR